MLLWLCTAFLSFTGAFTIAEHDFHLSRCEIVYRSETESLEVIQQVFTDDLEAALRGENDPPLHLNTDKEVTGADSLISSYLTQHFTVQVEGEALPFEYLGKETATDPIAVWLYVEITNVEEFSALEVKYDLLCELFGDQRNIVVFQIDNGKKQVFLTDRSSPSVQIQAK